MNADQSDRKNLNPSYVGLRKEILELISRKPNNVLDIGCANGTLGQHLENKYRCNVYGVDYDQSMINEAKQKITAAWQVDLNFQSIDSLDHNVKYDLVVCGDVLEHIINPWDTLKSIRALINRDATVIVSTPNVGHVSTLIDLAFLRRWPYRDRGIHDKTHLRFFTRKNLVDLYNFAGFEIELESRNLRFFEAPSRFNFLAKGFDFPFFRSFFTFQYIHRLKPKQ